MEIISRIIFWDCLLEFARNNAGYYSEYYLQYCFQLGGCFWFHWCMLIQSPYVPANLLMSVPGHVCVASTNYIVLFNLNVEIIDIKQHATRVNLGATIVFVPFPHADLKPLCSCEPGH